MSSQPAENSSRLPRKEKKKLRKNEVASLDASKPRPTGRRHLHALPNPVERPYRTEAPKAKSRPSPRRPAKSEVMAKFADTLRKVDASLYEKATDPDQNLEEVLAAVLANESLQQAVDYHRYEPSRVATLAIVRLVREPKPKKEETPKPKFTQAQEEQRANTPRPPQMVVDGKARRTRSKGAPRKVSRTIDRIDYDLVKDELNKFVRSDIELKEACISGSFDFNDDRVVELLKSLSNEAITNPRGVKATAKAALPEVQRELIEDEPVKKTEKSMIPGVELKKAEPTAQALPNKPDRELLSPRMQALFDRLPTPAPGTSTAHGDRLSKEGIEKAERFLNSPRP